MYIRKISKVSLFISLIGIILSGCKNHSCQELNLKKLGTIQFRRSYANHLTLTEKQLDSLEKSNPNFDLIFNDSKPELLDYLTKLGFANKNELFLNKIDTLLQDSITISTSTGDKYSISSHYQSNNKTLIYINSKDCKDSILLEQELIHPLFRQVTYEPENKKFVFVYWQYYFMNGDMYDVALYEMP